MRERADVRRTAARWVVLGALACGIGALLMSTTRVTAQAPGKSEWLVPERRARRPNPVPANAQTLAQGKTLYARECESCHGRGGLGDGPKARELETKVSDLTTTRVKEQTDGALFFKITEGRGDMPNTSTVFTEEERWMVVNYVRTLAASRQ